MENYRTDLAVEIMNKIGGAREGAEVESADGRGGTKINRVRITSEAAARDIGKPIGNYHTVDYVELDSETYEYREEISKDIAAEIDMVAGGIREKKYETVLVAGLGNRDMTADALGSYVCERIFVTRHIKAEIPELLEDGSLGVAVIAPGVFGVTGIETEEVITSVSKRIEADLVVLIDSLAALEPRRIGTSVQISDTGIIPGSGVGNKRTPLNSRTLGADVIAIGVPMVTYATTIAKDASGLERLEKTMMKKYENMVVTPKNIDEIVEKSAETLAKAIDRAINPGIARDFIELIRR